MYMIYLCIVEQANIYRYVIYLTLYIIILILDTITLRWRARNTYLSGIFLMLITMAIFTEEYVTANAILFTLLSIFFHILIYKIKVQNRRQRKSDTQIANTISIGFYLGVGNIAMLILVLFLGNYIT